MITPLTDELFETPPIPALDGDLNACLNALGTYSTERFVLRLSPRIHELLEDLTADPNPVDVASVGVERVEAYSTYLHETIHWWQHIGSTAGLVFSLGYLSQGQGSLRQLRRFLEITQPTKPVIKWALQKETEGRDSFDDALRAANTAINNIVDIEFYKLFANDPKCVKQLYDNKYFECIGHSYWISYAHAVSALSASIDPDFQFLPDARKWDSKFAELKSKRVVGFYHGSPLHGVPLGLRSIFEGQARFSQLQYLSPLFKSLDCEAIAKAGYFDGIYGDAFRKFLELSETEWPDEFDDPIIGLFLLVCDLAINPCVGFPLDIKNFERFIVDCDAGCRFTKMSIMIAKLPELKGLIKNYSKEEYELAVSALCKASGYVSPLVAAETVAGWASSEPTVITLQAERESFKYSSVNIATRVVFSHFVDFYLDKRRHPEFFCWPGAWMAGERCTEEKSRLFLRHLAPFSDKGDDQGIYPRNAPGRDQEAAVNTLSQFYASIVATDLTIQWVLRDGPFLYDYRWLTEKYPKEELESWSKALFNNLYGVHPDKFRIL